MTLTSPPFLKKVNYPEMNALSFNQEFLSYVSLTNLKFHFIIKQTPQAHASKRGFQFGG